MSTPHIQDVWAYNLEEEMAKIRDIVDDFPMIAMDTEFPGVVARPLGPFKSSSDYHYQTLRCNVDLLRIIQLGVTFSDSEELAFDALVLDVTDAAMIFAWDDMYAQDSIDLLTRAGIDFNKNQVEGIDVSDFGEVLMTSGVVLSDQIRWISFHSGYDFGYILKLLTCQPLPQSEEEFFEMIKMYFPCIYDIKYLMKSCKSLKGGLNDLAEDLQVDRFGPQHQAGSDSLLTLNTFFKMKQLYFEDNIDDEKYMGILYGLGPSYNPSFNQYSSAPPTNSTSPYGYS